MDTKEEIIKINGYTFKITETKMIYGGDRIISHTFKIGGDYDNCIGVSYTYNNNKPVSAKIPHALYEPECSIGSNLEKGIGTVLMMKTLLRYVHNKIPSITTFQFDDMSHIDCIPKNTNKQPPRPSKKPLSLAYLSIAYNSKTWYEEKFNATLIDSKKYSSYREKISFLKDQHEKVEFTKFLEIAKPPIDQISYLESIYIKSKTYREFFDAIPKAHRCDILSPWLVQFMEYYLKGVFSTNDWQINVTAMNGGSRSKTRKAIYPSKYKMINYKEYHMM